MIAGGRRIDVMTVMLMCALALLITGRLWANLGHGLAGNPQDEAFLEWMLAHGARVLADGSSPFFSDQQNYPDGVNMMANTSVLGVSLPLAPITALLGAHTAFTVFLTGGLALTGLSWYAVLTRGFGLPGGPAMIGATVSAFTPGVIAHTQGHPNIVGQFLIPPLILQTLRLRHPGTAVRGGVLLAALAVWQFFINAEILLMTAVALGTFCLTMAALRPDLRRSGRQFLRGLGVTAAATALLLAYPLTVLFAGRQAYAGLPVSVRGMGSDLAAFVALGTQSLGGSRLAPVSLAQNAAEQNTFFGWSLIILTTATAVAMRRNVTAVALSSVAGLAALLALGPRIVVNGAATTVPGPWSLLQHAPVFNSMVPTRWGLVVGPAIGILLALAARELFQARQAAPGVSETVTVTACTILAMALVPLTPAPLPTSPKPPPPAFITAGLWRPYLGVTRSLVTLPLPDHRYLDPLRWSTTAGADLRIPRGYFLGPATGGRSAAAFSAPPRFTDTLFRRLRDGESPPVVTDDLRAAVRSDLRYWRAGAVIVAPQPNDQAMRTAMGQILGREPELVGGVWLWDARALLAADRAP